MTHPYTPPTIWQWDKNNGGKFAATNRPTAGATFQKTLPQGDKPLQLYSMGTPNGMKVAIMLEELLEQGVAAATYDAFKIDIMAGDQFGSDFVAINPNSKIPALLDTSQQPALPIFESGAILLYLAEKFGKLIPQNLTQRSECLSWLFWQMASAPYVGGGFGHFYATRLKNWNTPSIALRWKPNANWIYSISILASAIIFVAMTTPLPILPFGLGMDVWYAVSCMMQQNFYKSRLINTSCGGQTN